MDESTKVNGSDHDEIESKLNTPLTMLQNSQNLVIREMAKLAQLKTTRLVTPVVKGTSLTNPWSNRQQPV